MYEVNYACNQDGDHTAPITECSTSKTITFSEVNALLDFITECSYVYNREKLFDIINKESFSEQSIDVKEVLLKLEENE